MAYHLPFVIGAVTTYSLYILLVSKSTSQPRPVISLKKSTTFLCMNLIFANINDIIYPPNRDTETQSRVACCHDSLLRCYQLGYISSKPAGLPAIIGYNSFVWALPTNLEIPINRAGTFGEILGYDSRYKLLCTTSDCYR